jgi:hypothetical protein
VTREEIAAMIQEAILAERKRICAALRSSRPEYDWGMSMVSIAEEIEKGED